METLNTVIEFVSSGTGGGAGDAAATGSSATADPLFAIFAVLIAIATIGFSLVLYARHNKMATANATALHARSSIRENCAQPKNNIASKVLISVIGIIIAATCFAICTHNNALAEENSTGANGIATISDKVKAHVDDGGVVTIDKGIITNNDGVLADGVRQVKVDSTVDLCDATLQLKCNNQVLFDKTFGETQLNDKYATIPVGNSADLTYTITISAEKAKSLVGTSPITLSIWVDSVVSKTGTVNDASDKTIEGAKVTYSYQDPYDKTKLVTGQTTTDENGEYIIPDVKKGAKVTLEAYYNAGGKEYYTKTDPISFDDEKTEVPPVILKEKINYKPIQTTIDGTAVTFVPAYNGTDPGCKFYTKSGENYVEIEGITNMLTLAIKVKSIGAENVYTDASGKTFYGTISRSWQDTFKADTGAETISKGLNSDFKTILNIAGVKTEYFDTNESEIPKANGNWNHDTNDEPTLGEVGYNSFYEAYERLLSSTAYYPWSSRALNSFNVYGWDIRNSYWSSSYDRTNVYAVILSKDF